MKDEELIIRSYQKIRELQQEVTKLGKKEKIAIIGMGLRFPGGSNTPADFWNLIVEKRSGIGEAPWSRWQKKKKDLLRDGLATEKGGFLDAVYDFDPEFFRLTPREAAQMDPQHRLLMEVCQETLTHASCSRKELQEASTGVFVGITPMDYLEDVLSSSKSGPHTLMGGTHNAAAGRLAYTFGFQGPVMAVDAACASSLVTVDLAVNYLRTGGCDIALAGGVNLILNPKTSLSASSAGMLSPDGECYSFDDAANGYVRSEGCGLVLLKRLSDAIRDGNRIWAVISGSAINNNGTGSGFTTPNGIVQERLIGEALADAGLCAGDIDFVEAHGTGTALGDPIELNALQEVFGSKRERPLYLSTLKTNLGHMESAAGIGGLIKTVLTLYHGQLPPQRFFEKPNQRLDWNKLNLHVVTQTTPWPQTGAKRTAGVSSFGISGSNAHLILEQAPANQKTPGPVSLEPHKAFQKKTYRIFPNDYPGKDPAMNREKQWSLINVLASRLAEHSGQATLQFPDLFQIEELVRLKLFHSFHHVLPPVGKPCEVQELAARIGVQPQFENLFLALLKVMAHGGFLSLSSSKLTLTDSRNSSQLSEGLARLEQDMEERLVSDPVVKLSERCIACLLKVLQGEMTGLQALFPQGSSNLVEKVYSENYLSVYYNERVAWTVKAIVAHFVEEHPGRKIRLLELGAGSGATTKAILKEIEPFSKNVSYTFSDITPAFVTQAKKRMKSIWPFMDFRQLNLEKSPEDQGFQTADFDVIIATNVLHATSHLRGTLGHLARLLDNAGCLVVNELTQVLDSTIVTFGLTREWWSSEDSDQRLPNSPLLSEETWKKLILEEEFSEVEHLRNRGEATSPQTVLVARRESRCKDSGKNNAQQTGPLVQNPAVQNLVPTKETIAMESRSSVDHDHRNEIVGKIKNAFSEITDIPVSQLQCDLSFFEMGLDSLLLIQIQDALEKEFDINLDSGMFYADNATITSVSSIILEQLPEEIMAETKNEPASTSQAQASPVLQPQVGSCQTQIANGDNSLQRIMADQLAAMNQLIAQQLQVLGQQKTVTSGASPSLNVVSKQVPEKAVTRAVAPPPIQSESAFVPYKPVSRETGGAQGEAKSKHLESLIHDVSRLTGASKSITQDYRQSFANNRNIAGLRKAWKEMTYQIVAQRTDGSCIWDKDGRRYVDLTMGFGVNLFGHNQSFILDAIQKQMAQNASVGPIPDNAGDVARRICKMTGMERAAFYNSGTEAVMVSLRLARAVTRRNKIVIFEGAYHGSFDGLLAMAEKGEQGTSKPMAPGITPNLIKDVWVLPYGEETSLAFIREHASELAAVLVEPVQSRRPDFQPREFLAELRQITTDSKTALIFDEIVTGFRIEPGGAQAHFGIRADLATYGKIIGGGLPLGIVAGKTTFMDAVDGGMWRYGDGSYPSKKNTFVAGTFCYHPLTMAACGAVLDRLEQQGSALQEDLNQKTQRLCSNLNRFFKETQTPIHMVHFGSLFRFVLKGDLELLFHHLLIRGIYVWEGRNCFISTAHSEQDLTQIYEAVTDSVRALAEGGLIPQWQPQAEELVVPPMEENRTMSMSRAQQRLFSLCQFSATGTTYNIPYGAIIEGALDPKRLENALKKVIARHDSLRSQLFVDNGEFQLQVQARASFSLTQKTAEESSLDVISTDFVKPFELGCVPLLRCCLVHIGPDRNLLLIDVHHTIFDGISGMVFFREMIACYEGKTLPPVGAGYADFIKYEMEMNHSDLRASSEQFWLEMYKDGLPETELPTERPRPGTRVYSGSQCIHTLSSEKVRALRTRARNLRCSLYHVVLAAFYAYLARVTQQQDLVVGLPVSGRADKRFRETIGLFVNTLVPRIRFSGDPSLGTLAELVKDLIQKAMVHQAYPFDLLVDRLVPVRDQARNPLFNMVFLFETEEEIRTESLTFKPYTVPTQTSMFDLSLEVVDHGEQIKLRLIYNTHLYSAARMQNLLYQYENLLDAFIANPDQNLSRVDLLTGEERELISRLYPQKTFPDTRSIAQIFDSQAEARPNLTAVSVGDEHLTYKELKHRAEILARSLVGKGVGPGERVAICMERGLDMITATLAILKAGAAYVPVDPRHPSERNAYILKDAGVSSVIVDDMGRNSLTHEDFLLMSPQPEDVSPHLVLPQVDPAHLAYVIYTSGTTGNPKGVAVSQESVVRLLATCEPHFGFKDRDTQDVWTMFHTLAFDFSVFEMFGVLLNGGRLVVVPYSLCRSPEDFYQLLLREKVTVLSQTPTAFKLLCEVDRKQSAETYLRAVVFGGEALAFKDLIDWTSRHDLKKVALINMYGITETTVHTTFCQLTPELLNSPQSLIGLPLEDLGLYLLDKNMFPVPPGIPGEIHISGAGVARGYLNRPALTAQRFVPNPTGSIPGDRLYKAGDLARCFHNGQLEYMGRIDHQVQVNGYRVELGEIEAALGDYVHQAVVLIRNCGGLSQIVAYVVLREGETTLDRIQLLEKLRRRIPVYMLPSVFVVIDTLPLTANGKLDRKALPEVEPENRDEHYTPPQTRTEQLLAQIFEEVLMESPIGIEDQFFARGGDSIKAIQICSRLRRHGLRLKVEDIFLKPTIRELAANLSEASLRREPDAAMGNMPLTPVQSWFFETTKTDHHHFNLSALLHSKSGWELEALNLAMQAVFRHHDALRMSFEMKEGKYSQCYGPGDRAPQAEMIDLRGVPKWQEALEAHAATLQSGFCLDDGILLASTLFLTDEGSYLLLIVHHLVFDGVSWRIFLEDLHSAYQQAVKGQNLDLPPKTDTFKQWSDFLVQHSQTLTEERSYWEGIIGADIPELPVNGPAKPGSALVSGKRLTLKQTEILLKDANRVFGTSITEILLAALAHSLFKLDGRPQTRVMLEGHGREPLGDIDTSRTLGWFTSMYPVLLEAHDKLEDQLKSMKDMLQAVPGKGLGYGLLKPTLPAHDAPQILFNYLGSFDGILSGLGLQLSDMPRGSEVSSSRYEPFALNWNVMIVESTLTFSITYRNGSFHEEVVIGLAESFTRYLTRLAEVCSERNSSLPETVNFTYNLEPGELEAICTEVGASKEDIEDICPLTPMQEGMLFRANFDENARADTLQIRYDIEGPLRVEHFHQCWERRIVYFDNLRTAFVFRNRPIPVQIVLKNRTLPFFQEDLREMTRKEQETYLASWRETDWRSSFDLTREPLFRIALFQTGDESYHVVITHHHIILDGWSLGLILKDFFDDYQAENLSPIQPSPYPFSRIARWFADVDLKPAKEWWKHRLSGFQKASHLPPSIIPEDPNDFKPAIMPFEADQKESEILKRLAREQGVTINTLICALWALQLGKMTGKKDLVFGVVVSGRSPEIEDVENIAGLFINMVPLRVSYTPETTFPQLLQQIQKQTLAGKPYEFLPLTEIQGTTPLRNQLFDHYLVIENYPLDESIADPEHHGSAHLEIRNIQAYIRSHFNLFLRVNPRNLLRFEFAYNGVYYNEPSVLLMKDELSALIKRIITEPNLKAAALTPPDPAPKIIKPSAPERHKKLSLFKSVKPKTRKLNRDLIVENPDAMPGGLLLVTPQTKDVALGQWLSGKMSWLDARLQHHGAILFRDFTLKSASEFADLISTICRRPMDYSDQSSPRTKIGEKIYTSTDHPCDQKILMHNELSYSANWPMRLFFYCEQEPEAGGETPLADSRQVLAHLSDATRSRFREKGIRYRRRLTPELGLSWQSVYQTNDRAEVEEFCRENGVDLEWNGDNDLTITFTRDAIQKHPVTGEEVWFNHGYFFNAFNLDPDVRALLSEEAWPFNTFYGDGAPIEEEVLMEIREAFEKAIYSFPWRNGDLVILDNMLVAHGRNAYRGDRMIRVAMSEPHH